MFILLDESGLFFQAYCGSFIEYQKLQVEICLVFSPAKNPLTYSHSIRLMLNPIFKHSILAIFCCVRELLQNIVSGSNTHSLSHSFSGSGVKEWVVLTSWCLSCKESTCWCRRHGFNPWVGKVPWRRWCNPLQYSCLGNSMDRGAWRATSAWSHRESDVT